MTKDTWGAMSKIWVVGEIGLQFNRLGSQTTTGGVTGLTGTAPAKTQLTMLTIDVAPKINSWKTVPSVPAVRRRL